VTTNTWNHIVGVFDKTAHKLYLNGILVASTPTTSPIGRSGIGISLMKRWDAAQFWGGALGIVRIYYRNITSNGVVKNFNAGRSRFGL
jgi:Concanavalin A-like lectin/glucanases superfamily